MASGKSGRVKDSRMSETDSATASAAGMRRPSRIWRLRTAMGEQARLDPKRHAPAIRAALHEGIPDAGHVTAVKVLRQLIRNAGGAVD